jgi:hypothetical protein
VSAHSSSLSGVHAPGHTTSHTDTASVDRRVVPSNSAMSTPTPTAAFLCPRTGGHPAINHTISACSWLGCPEGAISGRYLRLCPRDRAIKVDFRRPRRRLRCSASDIAKRCLTAGCRGALADSGDVNCRWIPQVSQLMLRGVGHRRRGSFDPAGALSRALLDEAFSYPGSVFNARCCAACVVVHDWAALSSPRCRPGSTACSSGPGGRPSRTWSVAFT